MVTCTHCNSANSLDSHFCKGCGTALPSGELEAAHQKVESLVAEGFRAFSAGQAEEAAMIADSALSEDPECASALSLKAMCHERAGQFAAALETFEKVLTIKPDSALDRIKVAHLRKALAARLQTSPKPDRKTAFIAGVSAGVLVIAAGVSLAGFMNLGTEARAQNTFANGDSNVVKTFADIQAAEKAAAEKKAQLQNQATPPAPQVIEPQSNPDPAPEQHRPIEQPRQRIIPNRNLELLPDVSGNAPVSPPLQGTIGIQPQAGMPAGSKPDSGLGGTKRRSEESPDPDIGPIAEPTKANNGYIDIRVSSRPPNLGNSVEVDENQTEALLRSAQQQYLLGKFESAAKIYEKALSSGASASRTNQRLGQCYEKLNRKQDAISAYTRAAAAYEAAGNQTGLEACRQALKVLKGG